jgi:hypothetical protein
MHENPNESLEKWKANLEENWRAIPKEFRNDSTVRRSLQCHMFGQLRKEGFIVVADYLPPRNHDRPIDLIALGEEHRIEYAVCFDTVVTLAAVKSLSSFEAANRVIYTIGMLEKKVMESRFFLKPEITHIHLKPFKHFQ